MSKCRLCQSEGKSQAIRAPIVFGDMSGEKVFYQCGKCNLIYMWPPLNKTEEANFYAQEFEKFMEIRSGIDVDWTGPEKHAVSNAENVLRRWNAMERACNMSGNILEVGCSSGFMLDKFAENGMGTVGIEPSGGFSEYLKEKNYEIYGDIDDLPEKYNEYFDVICHFFVLEHISDTRKFLKQKLDLLRPGGTIFCEVPSATDPLTAFYNIPKFEEFYWSIAHHYYFTPQSIDYLMTDVGITDYEIVPEQRYDMSNHMTWLQHGVPGGQGKLNSVFSSHLEEVYKNDLLSRGFFDTFFLIIRK
jgi:SAM-dependent methyltransferase